MSSAAQDGTLKSLERVTKEKPAVTELELWTIKRMRESCVVWPGLSAEWHRSSAARRCFRHTELHRVADLAAIRSMRRKLALRSGRELSRLRLTVA